MIWNEIKLCFLLKSVSSIIFHRSAHSTLCKKLEQNIIFFQVFWTKLINIHLTILPPPFTFPRRILDQPLKSEREKTLFVEKRTEGRQDGDCRASSSAGKNALSSRWWEKGDDYIPVGRTA